MAERYVDLSLHDQRDALEVAAQLIRRPAYLLEKDVWVVWTLDILFRAGFRDALVFKGGTSLSKAFGIIDRFSEDVDLTYDIRRPVHCVRCRFGPAAGIFSDRRRASHEADPHVLGEGDCRTRLLPAWRIPRRSPVVAALDRHRGPARGRRS
jgi:hypothetical protein